ncbi:uncharacterized protein LOC119094862 [Pollicipes pollicipes]|uniref:uncharacterized protein LOC119094862 n=1 Tax=Pollicipes pollicipes TaxID=41117 RepID=UPI001884EA2C|nr:uncharacterized protein LOC119094862 [Pollicipes pollicipes]
MGPRPGCSEPGDRWSNEYIDPETSELVREEYDRRVEDVGGEQYEYERAIVTREKPDDMTSRRRGCPRARRDPCGGKSSGGFGRYGTGADCGGGQAYRSPCDGDQEEQYIPAERIAKADERLDALASQLKESYTSLNEGLCKVQKCMTEGFATITGKMKEIEKSTDKTMQGIDDQIRTAEEELNKNVRLLNNDIAETQETFCRNLDKARRDMEKMEKHFRREICEILRDMKADACS